MTCSRIPACLTETHSSNQPVSAVTWHVYGVTFGIRSSVLHTTHPYTHVWIEVDEVDAARRKWTKGGIENTERKRVREKQAERERRGVEGVAA